MSQGFLRRESLLLVGTVILCLIAFVSARRYNSVVSQLDNLSTTAARADVQDRLMGTLVDVTRLNTKDEDGHQLANGKPLIIWVLDLERCDACLATIGDWKRLEALADHELLLLVIGEPVEHSEKYLRTLLRTHVRRADRETVLAELGPILPSTKLLLDPAGVTVMADSRTSGADCGWSFESQVGYLRGLNPSSSIRPLASLD